METHGTRCPKCNFRLSKTMVWSKMLSETCFFVKRFEHLHVVFTKMMFYIVYYCKYSQLEYSKKCNLAAKNTKMLNPALFCMKYWLVVSGKHLIGCTRMHLLTKAMTKQCVGKQMIFRHKMDYWDYWSTYDYDTTGTVHRPTTVPMRAASLSHLEHLAPCSAPGHHLLLV